MRCEERGQDATSDWAHTFLGLPLRGPALKSVLLQAQVVEKWFSLKEGCDMHLTWIHIVYKWQEQEM